MNILLNPIFLAVSLGHLGVDILNGSIPVFLAFLSGPLGLSNTTIGAISTTYSVLGALSQPLFGFLTDRRGARWVVAGGILAMALAYIAGILSPGVAGIGFLLLASVGSGAFHPAGVMQATLVGRERALHRETTSTSYFFLAGQIGLFLGPLLAGLALAWQGASALVLLTLVAFPVGVMAAITLQRPAVQSKVTQGVQGGLRAIIRILAEKRTLVISVAVLAALRVWVQSNLTTFMPKYLSDLSYAPALYGMVASLYMGGSAIGNVLGGSLADRYGKHKVTAWTLGLAALPLAALPWLPGLEWFYWVVPAAGFLGGASTSIVVVYAQSLIPGGMGLASGLTLGFMFAAGALGTVVSGALADQLGIPFIFSLSAGLALIAAWLGWKVLRERQE